MILAAHEVAKTLRRYSDHLYVEVAINHSVVDHADTAIVLNALEQPLFNEDLLSVTIFTREEEPLTGMAQAALLDLMPVIKGASVWRTPTLCMVFHAGDEVIRPAAVIGVCGQ